MQTRHNEQLPLPAHAGEMPMLEMFDQDLFSDLDLDAELETDAF